MGPEARRRAARIASALAGALLVAGVLRIAGPGEVAALLRRTAPGAVLAAGLVQGAMLFLRGLRLRALLGSAAPSPAGAWAIAAASRAAALFLPVRSGELVLPVLLARAGVPLASGTAALLVARALDLAALGAWGAVSILEVSGRGAGLLLALAGLAPLVALPLGVEAAYRSLRRWVAARGTGRGLLRKLRRLRAALRELLGRPAALIRAAALSVAVWGAVWALTWILLAGMGYRWPVAVVVAGSATASAANLLPVNLVANVGPLEAGWTAAFTALGVPARDAAATGFATHLWSLLLAAALGGVAWVALAARPGRTVRQSDERRP